MDAAEKHQRQLLDRIRFANRDNPISQATENAYLQVPRHRFLPRYRMPGSKDWQEVRTDNLGEHLSTLYADGALILSGDDDGNITSTISQPSLVLRMLDLMKLEQGQKIFELGAGSGWNATLIGHLVGPTGHVYSLEIIPEVAKRAANAIDSCGAKNVSVIEADGGEGFDIGAPYDRAVFTAGTYDLPEHFYRQIKENGLLLVSIKCEGGGDNLFLLRKTDNHFESLESMQCAFVQMTGKHRMESLEPICLENLPEWSEMKNSEVSKTPFWWGGKGKQSFVWRTLGVRSFLGVAEPLFQAFSTDKPAGNSFLEQYFGLWDRSGQSLVVAKDDSLISYGSTAAQELLIRDIENWVSLGMPTTASFQLQVYPSDFRLAARRNQWLVKRNESQFLWSLAR